MLAAAFLGLPAHRIRDNYIYKFNKIFYIFLVLAFASKGELNFNGGFMSNKSLFLICAFFSIISFNSFAAEKLPAALGNPLDFAAPIVNNRSNLAEAGLGTIVFDYRSGAFYGLAPDATSPTNSGTWIQLGGSSTTTAVVSGGSTGQRIERVSFGGSTERSNCTSSLCTIYRSTAGIDNVVRNGTGDYSVNFVTGTFTERPTCNVSLTVADNMGALALIGTYDNTTAPVVSRSLANSLQDAAVEVICIGN